MSQSEDQASPFPPFHTVVSSIAQEHPAWRMSRGKKWPWQRAEIGLIFWNWSAMNSTWTAPLYFCSFLLRLPNLPRAEHTRYQSPGSAIPSRAFETLKHPQILGPKSWSSQECCWEHIEHMTFFNTFFPTLRLANWAQQKKLHFEPSSQLTSMRPESLQHVVANEGGVGQLLPSRWKWLLC